MLHKLAFIYPWATHGGVEKVMIERAKLLNDTGNYQVDILFTHDSGAADAITSTLSDYQNVNVKIIELDYLLDQHYTYIFCIDFPAALNYCHTHGLKYFVECHSAYKDNRAYLKNIHKSCLAILCPSEIFIQQLKPELKNATCPILLLRNFVPWDRIRYDKDDIPCLPNWTKKPLLFLGRMDKLKNITELLDAFVHLKERDIDKFMLVLCGPQSSEVNITSELEKRALIGDTVMLPPIPFLNVDKFLTAFALTNGIFISPSTGESFGLSAAEAICADIPVVLSNIEAHNHLVLGHKDKFTYSLHDSSQLAEKIEYISDNYIKNKESVSSLKDKFSAHAFISDWDALIAKAF